MSEKRCRTSNRIESPPKKIKKLEMDTDTSQTSHVLMPWQDETIVRWSERDETGEEHVKCSRRCDIIDRQLNGQKHISDIISLQEVIKSYNPWFDKNGEQIQSPWQFSTLEQYFSELTEAETIEFFEEGGVLSSIVNLAVSMKDLVPKIHLLKQETRSSITLHQLQIASILANGFLCTFPRKNNQESICPRFNFYTLFESVRAEYKMKMMVEKIKCIVHYFKRIRDKQPTRNVTYKRIYIPDDKQPRFDKLNTPLVNMRFDSDLKIEDVDGYLQVDFANKLVGGGVLKTGCVQEEIRFIICPELIAARLFTECLSDSEALLVTGAERFSNYQGYSQSFLFTGNCDDQSEVDSNNHRSTQVIMMDATKFNKQLDQFREGRILRELKKAYVGFQPTTESERTKPIATGNWGCGAFRGDPSLKCLIQLMASSEVGRCVLYCTFGDAELETSLTEMVAELRARKVTVGRLYGILRRYLDNKDKNQNLFDFVRQNLSQNSMRNYLQTPSTSTNRDFRTEKSKGTTKDNLRKSDKNLENSDKGYKNVDSGKYPKLDVTTVKGNDLTDENLIEMYSAQNSSNSVFWMENECNKEKLVSLDGDKGNVVTISKPEEFTRALTQSPSLFSEDEDVLKKEMKLSQSKISDWLIRKQT